MRPTFRPGALLAALALLGCGTTGGTGGPDRALPAGLEDAAAGVVTVWSRTDGRAPARLGAGWRAEGDVLVSTVMGLRCPSEQAASGASLSLTRVIAYEPGGTDTSCSYAAPGPRGAVVTVYATRAPGRTPLGLFEEAAASIAQVFGDLEAVPLKGFPPGSVSGTGHVAGYALPAGRGPAPLAKPYDRVTAVWTVSADGTHVKARATYPADEARAEEVATGLVSEAAADVLGPQPTV